MRALLSRPHGCVSIHTWLQSPFKGDVGHSLSLRCHILLLHLLHIFTKSMEKRLFVTQTWKQMAARQCSTSSPLQRYCSDIMGQSELHLCQRQEWSRPAVLAMAAMALRLLTCCQASSGKRSVPRGSNFTLWQSNYMEFTFKGGSYLSAGEVLSNSFHVYIDFTCERRKNWIINIQD